MRKCSWCLSFIRPFCTALQNTFPHKQDDYLTATFTADRCYWRLACHLAWPGYGLPFPLVYNTCLGIRSALVQTEHNQNNELLRYLTGFHVKAWAAMTGKLTTCAAMKNRLQPVQCDVIMQLTHLFGNLLLLKVTKARHNTQTLFHARHKETLMLHHFKVSIDSFPHYGCEIRSSTPLSFVLM